jgi:signal transduction histidine kinase
MTGEHDAEAPSREPSDGDYGRSGPPASRRHDEGRPRLLLLLAHDANHEQIVRWSADRYDTTTATDGSVRDALDRCDLCVVDGTAFGRHRETLLEARRASRPVFVPCLLVLSDPEYVSQPRSVWEVADDVVTTPIYQAELRGRVDVLLRARRYSVQLERQNDRLEQFAEVLSHDIRNPLNVAQGFFEVARSEGDPDAFDRVERAHDRMDELVSDLLVLARTGTAVVDPADVQLASVVGAAWETVETGTATLDVAVADGVSVRADESRLIELFENLLRNAIDHAGSDASVRVGTLADGEGFFVADDGPGVPADDRDRVFEYGYTTVEGGTGFGLSIVEQVVDAHDWSVRLADEDRNGDGDGGARFEIRFGGVDDPSSPSANVGSDSR